MNQTAHNLHLARRARFEREFVPLRPNLVRYAHSRTRNYWDAEDLAHEALLKAMRQADAGREWRNPVVGAIFYLNDAIALMEKERTTQVGGVKRPRFVALEDLK